jgi:hypothetical protein
MRTLNSQRSTCFVRLTDDSLSDRLLPESGPPVRDKLLTFTHAMRLFAVRLENADTIVVAAVDEQDALQKAGVTHDALNYVQDQLKKMGRDLHRAELVLDGVGPQPYEIRELQDLCLHLRISDLGTFELEGTDEPTHEALMDGYPIMRAAHKTIADMWKDLTEIENYSVEHDALIEKVFSLENTRLMIPSDEEEQP